MVKIPLKHTGNYDIFGINLILITKLESNRIFNVTAIRKVIVAFWQEVVLWSWKRLEKHNEARLFAFELIEPFRLVRQGEH